VILSSIPPSQQQTISCIVRSGLESIEVLSQNEQKSNVILLSTPSCFEYFLSQVTDSKSIWDHRGNIYGKFHLHTIFPRLQHIILDEADTLLSIPGHYSPSVLKIIRASQSKMMSDMIPHIPLRLVLVGASFPSVGPKCVRKTIEREILNPKWVISDHFHFPPRTINHQFVYFDSDSDFHRRNTILLQILNTSDYTSSLTQNTPTFVLKVDTNDIHNTSHLSQMQLKGKTMIFVRNPTTADILSNFLSQEKISHCLIHKHIGAQKRDEILSTMHQGEFDVIVCTPILSRGIDLTNINMVINYDFPLNSTDFLHQCGRTGRRGGLPILSFYHFFIFSNAFFFRKRNMCEFCHAHRCGSCPFDLGIN
jgi:superfamily II DNA/RNA helicase